MKLSLDELKVDSYTVQASETELAAIKGGTSWLCTEVGVSFAMMIVEGYKLYKINFNQNSTYGGSSSGGINTTFIFGPDTVKVISAGGQEENYYGIDSVPPLSGGVY